MSNSEIMSESGDHNNGMSDLKGEDQLPEDYEPKIFYRFGDTVDARSIFDVASGPVAHMSTSVDSLAYNMKHRSRGKCIIINNRTFDGYTRLPERRGTEMDGKALYGTFRSLNFEVNIYNDPMAKEIITILENVSKDNHSHNDCIVVCILTHGEQGILWARDEKYCTDSVFNFFKGDQCPTLAGKPKMFFIQACQGDRLDAGVALQKGSDVTDSGNDFYRIPNYADFLIAYSTVPGYYSWRNTTQGSWFIQALTQVLGKYASNMDLLTMMTIVSRIVAYDYESNVPNDPDFHEKKQIPCVTSMLTRLIFFTPKV
ncbi:caspase-like isoform X2 [Oppia nitens]|uniref:caspase-like isoform X2 n=1 Tax=Oppia nitens TaxID=1686743 RepID=UPI0023DC2F55|nr:caspase-like isoform X2 [Oppia nitens]